MAEDRRPRRVDNSNAKTGGPLPPRMRRNDVAPRKPRLPEGQRPFIDKEALSDIRGAAHKDQVDDVIKAFDLAGKALNDDDTAKAIDILAWAKAMAPRSAVIREALGIAHYLQGEFALAHSELLTYRRISNRRDQNHVLADCARAAERYDKVSEYVEEMLAAKVAKDRCAEGLMVLAGSRADRGDLIGALETLNRAELSPVMVEPFHPRLWYAAADIAERMGDTDAMRDYLEAIAAVESDFLDVADRLAALDGPS